MIDSTGVKSKEPKPEGQCLQEGGMILSKLLTLQIKTHEAQSHSDFVSHN